MSSLDIDAILDRLATDDQFREQMLGDPVGTFGAMGVTIDPADIPVVRSLPSKESLQADRDAIKGAIPGNVGMFPHILSTTK
jgi:putative modified peptide